MLILKYRQHLIKKFLSNHLAAATASRSYCDFAHRWMPGPYPKTKEEHEAAAAKYNLIPEDYVPTEEHRGLGDYPALDERGHYPTGRPYYLDYDEPFMRRNYGEPYSEFFAGHLYAPPIFDVPEKDKKFMIRFYYVFIPFLIFAAFGPDIEIHKAKQKQYPPEYFIGVEPKVHYEYGTTTVGAGHHHIH